MNFIQPISFTQLDYKKEEIPKKKMDILKKRIRQLTNKKIRKLK